MLNADAPVRELDAQQFGPRDQRIPRFRRRNPHAHGRLRPRQPRLHGAPVLTDTSNYSDGGWGAAEGTLGGGADGGYGFSVTESSDETLRWAAGSVSGRVLWGSDTSLFAGAPGTHAPFRTLCRDGAALCCLTV